MADRALGDKTGLDDELSREEGIQEPKISEGETALFSGRKENHEGEMAQQR